MQVVNTFSTVGIFCLLPGDEAAKQKTQPPSAADEVDEYGYAVFCLGFFCRARRPAPFS